MSTNAAQSQPDVPTRSTPDSSLDITKVHLTTASPRERSRGLIGWVTLVVSGSLVLEGITLRRTRRGNLTLSFEYYLAHYNNAGSDDFLRVSVVGATTVTVLEELGTSDYDEAVWESSGTSLSSFAGQTIYLLVEAADGGSGSLIEAAIDDVSITAE